MSDPFYYNLGLRSKCTEPICVSNVLKEYSYNFKLDDYTFTIEFDTYQGQWTYFHDTDIKVVMPVPGTYLPKQLLIDKYDNVIIEFLPA